MNDLKAKETLISLAFFVTYTSNVNSLTLKYVRIYDVYRVVEGKSATTILERSVFFREIIYECCAGLEVHPNNVADCLLDGSLISTSPKKIVEKI